MVGVQTFAIVWYYCGERGRTSFNLAYVVSLLLLASTYLLELAFSVSVSSALVSLCHIVIEDSPSHTYYNKLLSSASLRWVLLLVDSELRAALAPLALWDNIHNSWHMESATEP